MVDLASRMGDPKIIRSPASCSSWPARQVDQVLSEISMAGSSPGRWILRDLDQLTRSS